VQFQENYFLSLKRLFNLRVGTINTAISEDTDFYAAVKEPFNKRDNKSKEPAR
jgi:hypothetical protein